MPVSCGVVLSCGRGVSASFPSWAVAVPVHPDARDADVWGLLTRDDTGDACAVFDDITTLQGCLERAEKTNPGRNDAKNKGESHEQNRCKTLLNPEKLEKRVLVSLRFR